VLQGGRGRGTGQAGGCRGEAQAEVRGDFAVLGELATAYSDLEDSIAADPRMVEMNRKWIECMGDRGYAYSDEAEARSEIRQEFRPLLRSFLNSAREESGQDAGPERGNPLAAISTLVLTDEQERELAQLQDRERSIAVASWSCRADDVDQIEVINAEYESEFVATNRTLLEAIG